MPIVEGQERLLIPPKDSRLAAVLVAFLAAASEPTCVLTLRSHQLSRHQGEWSFPGGMVHPAESPTDAALREAAEELGIPPEQVAVLGTATPVYVPASHAAVVPVVAVLQGHPNFRPNGEVAEVFLLSLEFLRQLPLRRAEWVRNHRIIHAPYWEIRPPVPLWGATAMIANELLWLYTEFRQSCARL